MTEEKRLLRAIGQRLQDARINVGLTQDALAEESRIDRSSIRRYELGTTNWSICAMYRAMKVLDLTFEQLLGGLSDDLKQDQDLDSVVPDRVSLRVYGSSPRKT